MHFILKYKQRIGYVWLWECKHGCVHDGEDCPCHRICVHCLHICMNHVVIVSNSVCHEKFMEFSLLFHLYFADFAYIVCIKMWAEKVLCFFALTFFCFSFFCHPLLSSLSILILYEWLYLTKRQLNTYVHISVTGTEFWRSTRMNCIRRFTIA